MGYVNFKPGRFAKKSGNKATKSRERGGKNVINSYVTHFSV